MCVRASIKFYGIHVLFSPQHISLRFTRNPMSEEKQATSSWVQYDADTDFPIQNLPYGIFKPAGNENARCGVAIGKYVLDLSELAKAGLFDSVEGLNKGAVFHEPTLNAFMELGSEVWKPTRKVIANLLNANTSTLRDNKDLVAAALVNADSVTMCMPARIGDYTDFYASRNHAYNVGVMFRGKDNALQPNWTWMPIGYHGRASSVVLDGTPIKRPCGQTCQPDGNPPAYYTDCKMLDFELELGMFIGKSNKLGEPVHINDAADHIFGIVLMNDWSARDLQKWEYVPLGPFTGKNFGTTISPWIVTTEALAPFLVKGQTQDPAPLPYLDAKEGALVYDLNLAVSIQPEGAKEAHVVSKSNAKYLYWSFPQMVAHHSVNGCNLQAGDLLGSGTISGEDETAYGSMLELAWKGTKDVKVGDQVRKSIKDGDTVGLHGFAQGNGYRIGFGDCKGKVLPAEKKF